MRLHRLLISCKRYGWSAEVQSGFHGECFRCSLNALAIRPDVSFQPTKWPFRETQVLKMLVEGRSNKEIGVPLGIRDRTVKAHVAKLMRKVGVENRVALTVHAITHSLVSLH